MNPPSILKNNDSLGEQTTTNGLDLSMHDEEMNN